MADLFDAFNRINADSEYKAVEEQQNLNAVNYNTYGGYAGSRSEQDRITSLSEATKNLRPKFGYGQTDGVRVDNFSALRNGVVLTHFGEPQQHVNRISGPAYIFRAPQPTDTGAKLMQAEQTVAGKQSQGLVAISVMDNVLTPQLPCIKKVQPHQAVKQHPRHTMRQQTYFDSRMAHRN